MKTTRRHGVSDATTPKTTRLNVRLDSNAATRLRVHCAMTGMSPGEVLTRLCEGLREFSMPVNLSAKVKSNDRHVAPPCVDISAPCPALEVAA